MKFYSIFFILQIFFVTISAQFTQIPDPNFEQALIELGIETGPLDGEIETNLISTITILRFPPLSNITDLTGIEGFTDLRELNISDNNIVEFDVSSNSLLKKLNCNSNQIEILILGNNSNLEDINCSYNNISSLDLTSIPNLKRLNCSNNALADIDVNHLTNLEELYCSDNLLSTLIVDGLDNLGYLNCGENNLTSIDISKNSQLSSLSCYDNSLASIDIINQTQLGFLNISSNELNEIDLSENQFLVSLDCDNNNIGNLNLSNNINLTSLSCKNNHINSFDLSFLSSLYDLDISGNPITELDLSNNTQVSIVNIRNTYLRSLNIKNGNNHRLFELDLRNSPDLSCIIIDNPSSNNLNWLDGGFLNADNHTGVGYNCMQANVTSTSIEECYLAGSSTISVLNENVKGEYSIYDDNGDIICTIDANGNDLGSISIEVFLTKIDRKAESNYIGRDLHITPENHPNSPISITFYYTKEELQALMAQDPSINGVEDINFTKTDASCTGTFEDDNATFVPQSYSGIYNNNGDYWVKAEVSTFSTFHAMGGNTILPVIWSSFEILAENDNILLTWTTTEEVDNVGFEIQHSRDGKDWQKIGFKEGSNDSRSPSSYKYIHVNPNEGANYYRLKQVDFNGRHEFSEVRSMIIAGRAVTKVVPNPANDVVYLDNIDINNFSYSIYNIHGKKVKHSDIKENRIDISAISPGTYIIRINYQNRSEHHTFVKL